MPASMCSRPCVPGQLNALNHVAACARNDAIGAQDAGEGAPQNGGIEVLGHFTRPALVALQGIAAAQCAAGYGCYVEPSPDALLRIGKRGWFYGGLLDAAISGSFKLPFSPHN